MQFEQGNSGIEFFSKAVRHCHTQGIDSSLVCVDVNVAKFAKATQVVDTCNVVVVDVRQQYAVNLLERPMHQLHTNIGTAVDKHTRGICLQQSCTAIAEVARVSAATYFACAPQNGYTC